jgi:hypothetical protein
MRCAAVWWVPFAITHAGRPERTSDRSQEDRVNLVHKFDTTDRVARDIAVSCLAGMYVYLDSWASRASTHTCSGHFSSDPSLSQQLDRPAIFLSFFFFFFFLKKLLENLLGVMNCPVQSTRGDDEHVEPASISMEW